MEKNQNIPIEHRWVAWCRNGHNYFADVAAPQNECTICGASMSGASAITGDPVKVAAEFGVDCSCDENDNPPPHYPGCNRSVFAFILSKASRATRPPAKLRELADLYRDLADKPGNDEHAVGLLWAANLAIMAIDQPVKESLTTEPAPADVEGLKVADGGPTEAARKAGTV